MKQCLTRVSNHVRMCIYVEYIYQIHTNLRDEVGREIAGHEARVVHDVAHEIDVARYPLDRVLMLLSLHADFSLWLWLV